MSHPGYLMGSLPDGTRLAHTHEERRQRDWIKLHHDITVLLLPVYGEATIGER